MAYQKNNNYQQQDRQPVPELRLTPEQVAQLSQMTKREGYLYLDAEEIQMIAEMIPNGLYADFKRFIYRASGLQLNPLHNEIHMEYKYSKGQPRAQFHVHIDGWRKIADGTGKMDGFQQAPGKDERGDFVETTIWRNDRRHPHTSRVYFHEFMQSNDMYAQKSYHMVAKCGEALAHKIAFPVSGLLSDDEVSAWMENAPVAQTPSQQQPEPEPGVSNIGGYNVAEIVPEQKPAPAATAPPPPHPATDPDDQKKRWAAIAKELAEMGITKGELTAFYQGYFDAANLDHKPTPEDYVRAVEYAQGWIHKYSIEEFRANLPKKEEKAA